jgi:hypothetical protein
VEVTLGAQGEVAEASVIDGDPRLSEALLRAVRSWRFSVRPGMPPPSFTIRASWNPGPPPAMVLRALDLKAPETEAAAPERPAPAGEIAPGASPPEVPQPPALAPAAPPSGPPGPPGPPEIAATPTPPEVETEVLPARVEPPAKEEGVSSLPDVVLGENIPDLVKGRRPVWPPLARLGNVGGEVIVRFSVDLAGRVSVHTVEGPELLTEAAEQATATWMFRRTAIDRLNLIATFKYTDERAVARVERVP